MEIKELSVPVSQMDALKKFTGFSATDERHTAWYTSLDRQVEDRQRQLVGRADLSAGLLRPGQVRSHF